MHESIELSVIIVTWNSEAEIIDCLNSITEETKDLEYEIIIVDNNSSDKTIEMIRSFSGSKMNMLIIENMVNSGFTKACNTGIEASKGKNMMLLNPDTKITGNALNVLVQEINSGNTIGAVAPQLLNEDYSIQYSCRTFPTYFDMFCELSLLSAIFPKSRIFSRWKMNYFSHDKESVVEQPMAAALLIKKDILNNVDLFDERYRMFFNDVDMCKKIYDNGYEILFTPQAKIIHAKGVSIFKDRVNMIKVWNEDCLKFFKKYHYNILLYAWLYFSLKISGYLRIFEYKLIK